MKEITAIIPILLIVIAFGAANAAAQFTIKLPDININKPDKDKTKIKDTNTTTTTTNEVKTKTSDAVYNDSLPTNVPVLMKNTIYVQAKTHDEYWKMKGQSNYSSWVPQLRFKQYYNEEKTLNYTVEYFNPEGSLWYSENLESNGRKADRTVLYESPSPFSTGVLDTKSTAATGVYSFKITNADTKTVLYQGKFKVGKFSRAYRPEEKNKTDFYVEHDWLMPFATVGFHFAGVEIGGVPPLFSVWLKGEVNGDELEGRIFYKGRQIASTKDENSASGVNSVEDRRSEYAPAFAPQTIWTCWEFQFGRFLLDNNGGFNRDEYPTAYYFDKNPGEYTIKIYRGGAQIREMSLTVGANGRFVAPAYSKDIQLPYHTLVLPVKVVSPGEKDAGNWKTEAFYGNPLTGFSVQ